jgi:ABC-type nitrate/sulfonate/bicarbonate transport system permease component
MSSADNRLRALATPIVSVGLFLAAVELAKRGGALPITIPAPSNVAAAFVKDADVVLYHLEPTIRAAVLGFLAALVAGISCGTLATLARQTKGLIYNVAVVTYSVPLLALSPVLVVWLGTGPSARIIISALAGFLPILVATIQGLDAVDRKQDELFRVLSANRLQRFWLLAVPTAMPFLFSGLKVAAASAVLGTIVAEWAGAERGIGVMMAYALFSFDVVQLWLTVITATACAIGGYAFVVLVERIAMPWHETARVEE